MAFTGGTGALCFLDIVSKMILSNNKLIRKEICFDKSFEFHFYASFKSEQHGIGIELCRKLVEMNKKLGLNNFKFILRLAEGPHVTS